MRTPPNPAIHSPEYDMDADLDLAVDDPPAKRSEKQTGRILDLLDKVEADLVERGLL